MTAKNFSCVEESKQNVFFNGKKQSFIFLLFAIKTLYSRKVKLYNELITFVCDIKYLDVVVNSNFHDDNDVKKSVRFVCSSANMLRSKFYKC